MSNSYPSPPNLFTFPTQGSISDAKIPTLVELQEVKLPWVLVPPPPPHPVTLGLNIDRYLIINQEGWLLGKIENDYECLKKIKGNF